MSKWQVVKELHRDARKRFPRRHNVMRGIGETIQADLIELPTDRGFKYSLTAIDTFSKVGYAVPLKTKTGPEVTRAMQSILLSTKRPVKNLFVDLGREFYNRDMTRLLDMYKVNRYSTSSSMKAMICERFNRTLKRKIYQRFSLNGNHKWVDILQELVNEYNSSKHRTINMAPIDVDFEHEQELLDTVYNYMRIIPAKNKFRVGDHVRLSKYKSVFDKGYLPSWTAEVFKIRKIQHTDPITYLLTDWEGN